MEKDIVKISKNVNGTGGYTGTKISDVGGI